MDKVYIIIGHVAYEGVDILKVCSNEEKARSLADTWKKTGYVKEGNFYPSSYDDIFVDERIVDNAA
jgi:hypothetical protein